MTTTKRSGVAAALAATAVVLGASGPALAAAPAASKAGGQVRLFVNVNVKSQTVDPTLWTGAIGDLGTSTSVNAKGKVDPNGNFEQEKLRQGTFLVDVTKANAAVQKAGAVVNKTTCTFSLSASGPATLSKGTGLYKGIRGTITVTQTFGGIFPRKANGSCNFGDNVQPISFLGEVFGQGTVRFG